jgi:hypothetical protein
MPWSNQKKLIDQCKAISINAKWWDVLARFGVSFDPGLFSQFNEASTSLQTYCVKLIHNAIKKLTPQSTLDLSVRYANQFSVSNVVPPSILIECLLSPPEESSKGDFDLAQTETAVRDCLARLPIINQSKVLRKCVMRLEVDEAHAIDYDRHSMVLMLYRECIDKLAGFMKSDTRKKAHAEEAGRIIRRQNALVLLSSIFDKHSPDEKPKYNKLFEPLPLDPSAQSLTKDRKNNVLGFDPSENIFDPLTALHGVLGEYGASNSMAATLAPFCSLLMLPAGYIHARALVVHFRRLISLNEKLPNVETSVLPAMKRLTSSHDKAELAWWCSQQYADGSREQLHCLDLALPNATQASDELEYALKHNEASLADESYAIDRVKRIDSARAILSDHILVNEVIERHQSSSSTAKSIYKDIIGIVQTRSRKEADYRPEVLVRDLLVEGSMKAALASQDENDGFATHHFRSLAILVHDACKSLSDRYSHVNVGKCARVLSRRWLIHGDDMNSESDDDARESNANDNDEMNEKVMSNTAAVEYEDTSEFVMDIGQINSTGDQTWAHHNDSKEDGIRSNDEPSAFNPLSSKREYAEQQVCRVSLRIAFLMCFAEDYHRNESNDDTEQGHEVENAQRNVMMKVSKQCPRSKAQLPKLSRHKASGFEGDLALKHARELLSIVFAGNGNAVAPSCAFLFEESIDDSLLSGWSQNEVNEESRTKNKALSFAMRHRALRVASIICPHDVIVRVVLEEGYSSDVVDDHLDKIAFGSYVAMEIEAMGLPLPHSDLLQLSTMHFPSYSRTLWRNHSGEASTREMSGRLHLLLIELCINHHETIDWELLMLMFRELIRLELPRSLLLACDCAVSSKIIELAASLGKDDVLRCIESASNKVVELIAHEVRTSIVNGVELDTPEFSSTIDRIISIIGITSIHDDPVCFVQGFADLAGHCGEHGMKSLSQEFMLVSAKITSHIVEPVAYAQAKSIIVSTPDGQEAYDKFLAGSSSASCLYSESICSKAVGHFERSFE